MCMRWCTKREWACTPECHHWSSVREVFVSPACDSSRGTTSKAATVTSLDITSHPLQFCDHWDHPSMPGTTGTKRNTISQVDACKEAFTYNKPQLDFQPVAALLSTWQCNRNWCATRWNRDEFDWTLFFFQHSSQVTSIHSPKVATFEWWQNMLELALWHHYETLEHVVGGSHFLVLFFSTFCKENSGWPV